MNLPTPKLAGGPPSAFLAMRALAATAALAPAVFPVIAAAQTAEPTSLSVAATGGVQGRVLNVGTGRYLNNARVVVEGTPVEVFTNEYGEYRIYDLQPGEVKLNVFYTGLTPQSVSVQIASGQTLEQDLRLGASAQTGDTVQLDAFQVKSGRETNIAAIATNEQRFAPNIKTVIETDAFGDVAEGNVGEFLKFLPGVTVDYVAADVRTVSVRGFGAQFSSVYVDGFRMASASSGSSIRAFEFEQVSINNAARIEVAKVPTPPMGSDALGGSVNMISKNAFERQGAQFNYRTYLSANSEDFNPFEKSPGPGRKETYKVLPGFDFDYTLPVTKNLGFVITGLTSNQFNEQHRTQQLWNFAQAGGTPTAPVMQQYVMQDGPKNTFRDSFSAKMDWRISTNSSMWAAFQTNYYKSFFGNRNLTWEAGANAVPTPATGTPLTFSPEFTNGATGRGSVRHGGSFRDKLGSSNAFLTKYRYNGQVWEFDAGLGYSKSRSWYRDTGKGHFSEVRTTLQNVSRVNFTGIEEERPAVIQPLTATGAVVDYNTLGNYRINTVRSVPLDATDEFVSGHANLKRELNFLPFDASLQIGADVREQQRDIRRSDTTWNFVGADGVANTADDNAAAYLDESYGVYSAWGHENIQWYDPYELYDTFVSKPAYFQQTDAQARNAEAFRIQNSQLLTETVTAAYIQGEFKFLKNRLNIVTGVRFEKTEDEGSGGYTPTRAITLADVKATWRERGLKVSKGYDGYYPSLHTTFNITDDLVVRMAYAKSLGRPDFGNILPLVRANLTPTEGTTADFEALPANTIRATNPGLNPYEADNYDLSLEYYFRNGGVVSAGLFRKDIENFFGTRTRIATLADFEELNLDESLFIANRFTLETPINLTTTARITGAEFNFRSPLTFIPGIGKELTFFLNGTKLDLDGSAEADFSGFIEEAANTGITWSRKPFNLRLNANYRGRQILAAQTGAAYGGAAGGYFEYYAPRVNLDVNVDYRFSKRVTVFANVRNILNQAQTRERYNSTTPDYAKVYQREKFGAQITLGVKGTF